MRETRLLGSFALMSGKGIYNKGTPASSEELHRLYDYCKQPNNRLKMMGRPMRRRCMGRVLRQGSVLACWKDGRLYVVEKPIPLHIPPLPMHEPNGTFPIGGILTGEGRPFLEKHLALKEKEM